ncbi:transport and Golgi organization protein 1 homolog isoform X2 [Lagopus muta]|uniref:transport and Golgi organization protein 1 homolog isoform X2 n=1 Tax=Lagopus muta TaxID=64668 RepID=UPI0020A07A66|nr:transport and Golgi organization protein 1 homolog isoform X2 [Lagopus muta]
MAAAAPPDPRLLLAVLLLLPPPGPLCAAGPELSRRFTERKRCADPECSKLMCRGKAMKDFQGPDCRFVNFKKGETIYVYYKLIGMSTELWAGSIGSDFGYFPKDLLEINHNYTNEELELPTEETDFVCFQDGRDDFDNYNVDELLKSSEETIANERDAESSDPGTKPAERTERDKEEGKVDTVVFHDALETDNLKLTGLEDKEALAMTEEADSSLKEGTEKAEMNPTVNSHEEISQGEQIAHEHLQGMLSENLKGLESENTKNSSIPQGETSQLDKESEEINAYTLLNRELSVNLKTKFGSTADAVVSDDEVTRLVTSVENDFNEDLSINAHDAEEESDFVDQFEEIPLLSFMTEEESISLVDSEADESNGFESKHHKLDEYANGATELHNQRDNEEERDSDALITEDAFSENEKSGSSVNMDKFESEQTKEKWDEAMPVSKREAPTATQLDGLSKQLIRREPVGASDADSKEKTNKTEQFEEQLVTDEMVLHPEELKSTVVPDPRVLPGPGDGLKFKSFVESKQDALSPPAGDVNQSPEGVPLAEIEKEEEKFEGDTLKESSESNFKHRKLWEVMKEKEKAKYEPSGDVPAKPVEDVQNASQSDAGDTDLLKDKLEQGMPAVEKEVLRQEEDLKQTEEADREDQKPISVKKEPEIARGNMKETSANEGDPSHGGAAERPRPWENETEYSEADVKEELSRNLGKMTVFEESIEKSSPEGKSKSATQNTNAENSAQQGAVHTDNEDSDRNLGTRSAREKAPWLELQSEEPDAEEDPDLKQEEELLEDENAASAKLLQARLANVQGNAQTTRSTNPDLGVLSEALSGTANPTYETAEETNSFSEETKKISKLQDAHEAGNKEVDELVSEDTKLDEIEHAMGDNKESSEAEDPSAVEEYIFKSPDRKDSNDLNQRKDHLPEGISLGDSKEIQNSEDTRNTHQHSAHFPSPADMSAATNDTVTDYSESVKRLTITRDFLDEKRVIRLQKYLGLQNVIRIEAMFQDMKIEMELARKASQDNEEIEKALDQILKSSDSSIMDVVGKVLDSRVAENQEEVVKEMDLYDEESALMDDIQELIYSLRSKYSSASESVPLASFLQQEEDELHAQGAAKEAEYDSAPVRNLHGIDESSQKFQQLEDKRPFLPIEEEEEAAVNIPPEDEEAIFSDDREAADGYNSERELLLADSFEAAGAGESAEGDTAPDRAPDVSPSVPPDSSAVPPGGGASGEAPSGATRRLLRQLAATLPEDIRPGPDFHGLPWEPVIVTALVGMATLAIVFWRTCLSVKSRMYQVTEKQLAEKIQNLLQEKTEMLDKFSECDEKIKQAKESMKVAQEQKSILSDEIAGLKDTVKGLEETNHQLDDKIKSLCTMLDTERKQNAKKQKKLSETQKSLEKFEEAFSMHSAELSEVQIALNESKLSEEKVKAELQHVQEENARLKKSKEQLLKEAEGWSERHTELTEQIKLYRKSQKDIEEALAYKENEIEVLTNCIMQLKQLDTDSASEAKKDGEGLEWSTRDDLANGELPDNEKMKTQIKQMMDASRVKTMLSLVEEDRNSLQSKLSDEVAARHELEEQIKKLEHDSSSLQSAKARLENECKTLQQKVEILGELYQQKEMALQKKLTQEEYERQEKEQKLSAADEKAVLAIEEVKVYKQRIQDMEEELLKTERSYKNQIAAHEKKAHDNWLIARSAERALAEEKREAANLRQKLMEVNQKTIMLQRPLIVKPTPGRPDRQVPPRRMPLSRDGSFGPSPVSGGNPSPTQMMEVPSRPLSAPQREGSRAEFGTVVDGPPAPRRPPELPGRMSVPDLGPAVASLISSGPRTSSPATAKDRAPSPKEPEAPCVTTDSPSSIEPATVNVGPKGPPSFPGTPVMTSPVMGPLPPPPVNYGPPPAPFPGHYGPGPRPLPVPLVCGAPLPPPAARDFLPGPPLGMRDLPPGPLPPFPDPRSYRRGPPHFRPPAPPGPRDFPPGPPLPPPASRDYAPSRSRDLPAAGPRDCPAPPPAASKDYTQPPVQKP